MSGMDAPFRPSAPSGAITEAVNLNLARQLGGGGIVHLRADRLAEFVRQHKGRLVLAIEIAASENEYDVCCRPFTSQVRQTGGLTVKKYLSGGAFAAVAGAAMLLSFGATPAEARTPGGSYLQTCTNVHAMGDRVVATCQRSDGSWSRTAINDVDSCVGGLANAEGRLVCRRGGGSRHGMSRPHRWRGDRFEGHGSSYAPRQYYGGGGYWYGR
jgi:hypothetical protein